MTYILEKHIDTATNILYHVYNEEVHTNITTLTEAT